MDSRYTAYSAHIHSSPLSTLLYSDFLLHPNWVIFPNYYPNYLSYDRKEAQAAEFLTVMFGFGPMGMTLTKDSKGTYVCLILIPSVGVCALLSSCVCIYLCICLSVCVSVCLSVYLFVCVSVCVSVCLCICLSVYLFVCVSICVSIYLSVCLCICLSSLVRVAFLSFLPIPSPST